MGVILRLSGVQERGPASVRWTALGSVSVSEAQETEVAELSHGSARTEEGGMRETHPGQCQH